ncbi:MAG TPA: cytochrome c3 family protein [Anaeromyxobacteraceae bacterium]|nr:cytochrome c3 family protein [Anaeromyxobacteraceae bacterium]
MHASLLRKFTVVASAAVLALAACKGDDGAAGANGTSCTVTDNGNGTSTISCQDGTTATVSNGTDGLNGTDGQSCTMTSNPDGSKTVTCPDGNVAVLPAVTVSGKVLVTDQAAAVAGADVVVTFKVNVDGVLNTTFTNKVRAERHAYDATVSGYRRTSIATTAFTVSAGATGYTATFPGMATTIGSTPTTFLIHLDTGVAWPSATVVAHSPAGPSKSTVSDQACMNCHGANVFRDGHEGAYNPQGVAACVVCHVRYDRMSRGEPNDRLKSYVHGIHNSHEMPARAITADIDPDGAGPLPPEPFTVTKPDGVYARNDSIRLIPGSYPPGVAELSSPFSVGFPGYMINCGTCHDTDASLAYVLDRPVGYSTCMSCHDGWDGFPRTVAGGTLQGHRTYTVATTCTSCHDGSTAPANVRGFHNGKLTGRSGLVYDGKDQSIEQGKKIAMEITGVTAAGAGQPLVVTWIAYDPTNANAPYDPCNSDYAVGPVFFGKTGLPTSNCTNTANGCNSNLSLLRAFAQANDWVNEGVGTSPGQPNGIAANINITATNTTCASNVATTTLTLEATAAVKGRVAIQGKAQLRFAPTGGVIWTRSPSPTREFLVADGTLPTDTRRRVVDTAKCLSCHLGSLYQHGGNRVDNVDLCMMCHNPASNESQIRAGLGVDASEAYDFQAGQTFDLRAMVHGIHSAGESGHPLVYYRGMGIYFFGNAEALAAVPQWPGTGVQTIFGSNPPVTRAHNYIEIHYPRALNDCAACHVDGSENAMPMPWEAVAVTETNAGTDIPGQLDDELIGPTVAACMSCHQSGAWFTQAVLRGHAYDNSWNPQAFPNGRQDLIDGVEIESCILCHGPGAVADYSAMHAR